MNTSIIETLLRVVERAALHYAGGAVSDFSWFQFVPGISKPVGGQTLGDALHLTEAHEAVFIPTTWALVLFIFAIAGVARKSQQLDRQHWKDAGHQVQDQAAQQGSDHGDP